MKCVVKKGPEAGIDNFQIRQVVRKDMVLVVNFSKYDDI
jgi:hypothetical protein